MTDLQKQIILNKCYELKQGGYDHLNDSDIMDILEECERNNQPLRHSTMIVILTKLLYMAITGLKTKTEVDV